MGCKHSDLVRSSPCPFQVFVYVFVYVLAERSSSGGDSVLMGTFAELRKSLAHSAIEIIGDRPPDRFVYSIFATIVCFPIGACALRHSLHCRKATRSVNTSHGERFVRCYDCCTEKSIFYPSYVCAILYRLLVKWGTFVLRLCFMDKIRIP